MKLDIETNQQQVSYELAEMGSRYSGVITIGRKCKEVWNAISIDAEGVDAFQCHLIGSGDAWTLKHGQHRTECPKGLVSEKVVPCNGCMGRCVNIRPGRPKYYQRVPEVPTLLNGQHVKEYGEKIKAGDEIKLGGVTIRVV